MVLVGFDPLLFLLCDYALFLFMRLKFTRHWSVLGLIIYLRSRTKWSSTTLISFLSLACSIIWGQCLALVLWIFVEVWVSAFFSNSQICMLGRGILSLLSIMGCLKMNLSYQLSVFLMRVQKIELRLWAVLLQLIGLSRLEQGLACWVRRERKRRHRVAMARRLSRKVFSHYLLPIEL